MALEQITALILALRHESGEACRHCEARIQASIQPMMAKGETITFVLPAFPAKSVNQNKTLGPLPDLGEKLALTRLEKLCADIGKIYQPGASMFICSDGRVFNDLVQVTEENVQAYNQTLKAFVELKQFKHIAFYDLKDAYPALDTVHARSKLMNEYATPFESIQISVKKHAEMKALFNGLHRFMVEDLSYLNPELSKNALRKQTKHITYQMMQRSQAWSALLHKKFPNVFRLSIHGYDCGSEKFGIKLLPEQNHWATPWHNVILKEGSRFAFVKHQVAKALNAHLIFDAGVPSHYEVR